MSHDHIPETPQQPLPRTPHDPVADYLDFLEKISKDVDQIPDQKIDERARQLFGEAMLSNGLSVQGSSLEDVAGFGQSNLDCLVKAIAKVGDGLEDMSWGLSGVVEIVAAAQREADRIRYTARQEALAEAAQIRAEAERGASALMDTALTQAACIAAEAHRTAEAEAAHIRAEAERDASALMDSTREQVALLRRAAANLLTVPAKKVDADVSAVLRESGPEASREVRWLDEDAGPIVPAYLLTRGRTRPASEAIDLIAVIITADDLAPSVDLSPEHLIILQKCTKPARLVDVAAELNLPIGVTRVLVGDLHAQQLVQVEHPPPLPDARVLLRMITHLIAI